MAEARLSWLANGVTTRLDLDVTPTQDFERTAEVTEHPVEDGAPVSDHIRPTNGTITIEAVITNAPVIVPETQMRGATRAPGNTVVGGETVTALRWSGPFDRVRECHALLDALVAARVLVTLTTSLTVLDNLVLTRYKVGRSATSGDSLPITLDFRRLRLATTQRAEVPVLRQLQRPAAAGTQPPDDRSAAVRIVERGRRMSPEAEALARERARVRAQTGRAGL